MQINEILTDNLIASSKLTVALVPGLATVADKGPMVGDQQKLTLEEMSQHVYTDLAPANGADTSHARPTMLAGISSFAQNVNDALETGVIHKDFWEWQGMVAAVALRNVYCGTGLNLTIEVVAVPQNAAGACIRMEMEKDKYYKASVRDGQANLYYICQNGQPFALFHPEIGLCPMKEYDPAIFAGVLPWYENVGVCHEGWKNIDQLDDFCLSRVLQWTSQWVGSTCMTNYQTHLNNMRPGLAPLNSQYAGAPMQGSTSIDQDWPGRGTAFGTAMMAYLDENGVACPMPNLFLDTMMISSIGADSNNRMFYPAGTENQPVCFADGKLPGFVPVPPFYKDIMNLLGDQGFRDLTFRAELDAKNQVQRVTVSMEVDTGSGLFRTSKVYEDTQLRLGRMPYLILWPFVDMPQGLWKNYYATWHDQVQPLQVLFGTNGSPLTTTAQKLSYAWDNQGTTHEVFRATAVEEKWPVCVGTAPFRYAALVGTSFATAEETALGLVFMPKCAPSPSRTQVSTPVQLAVDFGTTSTVCALKSQYVGGGMEMILPFQDYTRCVTCEDQAARENTNTMHWLGSKASGEGWEWNKKLFSVAHLFEQMDGTVNRNNLGQAGNQEYYTDGRLFLVSGEALAALAVGGMGADPLMNQQILTDMKFNHALNDINYHGASVFLAGVYLHAMLFLLKSGLVPRAGVDFVELRVSFPNDVTLDALKANWGYARDILGRMMDFSLTEPITALLNSADRFYNESTAATAYQRRPGAAVTFTNSLVSVDIGGGTTDVSISDETLHPNDVRNLSVRYAGREIMVSSLVEFYRHVNPATPAVIDENSFSNLWGNASGTANLCHLFGQLSRDNREDLKGQTNNSTLRMTVEMLLAQGMDMGRASNTNPTNLPRQLIAMKFIMLLHIVAKMVRENIDMWKDPKTGEMALNGNEMEINLSVSGTSAQLLQYVFDCSMGDLKSLQFPHTVMGKMQDCLNLMNTVFYETLRDILEPLGAVTKLAIYIDEYVAEKKDVCFGMLQPGVDLLVHNAATEATHVGPGLPVRGIITGAAAQTMSREERAGRQHAMTQQINLTPVDSLEEYLHGEKGMMQYWNWYESIFFPTPQTTNRGLGAGINAMSELMKQEYRPYYTAARTSVANEKAAYMIEPEQAPYVDLLRNTYLVEELLDWCIAAHQ